MRIGQGFDAHRFVEGRPLVIGGVTIPYPKGLLAHSDGDVLIHALADALLGAASLGDIGRHFPNRDVHLANIDSRILLRKVWALVDPIYDIIQVDATLLGQEPHFSPFTAQMRHHLAQDLKIALECVSVKATTTDHMGFLGRGEGLAAMAIALVKKKVA